MEGPSEGRAAGAPSGLCVARKWPSKWACKETHRKTAFATEVTTQRIKQTPPRPPAAGLQLGKKRDPSQQACVHAPVDTHTCMCAPSPQCTAQRPRGPSCSPRTQDRVRCPNFTKPTFLLPLPPPLQNGSCFRDGNVKNKKEELREEGDAKADEDHPWTEEGLAGSTPHQAADWHPPPPRHPAKWLVHNQYPI